MNRLPHNPRPHALADLDRTILMVERARDRQRSAVARLEARGEGPGYAHAMLRLAEERLAQLRHSRQVLLGGEGPDEAGGTAP